MDAAQVKLFVEDIVGRYETRDVFSIAERAGVSVIYESWHPITFGEFERKTKLIRVNRRALEMPDIPAQFERMIVAHELAHFFALDWRLEREDEEQFARAFAEIFTGEKR